MNKVAQFFTSLVCIGLAFTAVADLKVVSVDTNNVANVDLIEIDTIRTDTVDFGANKLGPTGFEYDSGGTTVSVAWPTNLPSSNAGYLQAISQTGNVDPFATEWLVKKEVKELKDFFLVIADEHFYERYTNSPPSNINELLGYVSNCVYLLSHVEMHASYDDVTNEMAWIEWRLDKAETVTRRFGSNVPDLDYIINSDIEKDEMDASDMLDMIKTLARYIKSGNTNNVEGL